MQQIVMTFAVQLFFFSNFGVWLQMRIRVELLSPTDRWHSVIRHIGGKFLLLNPTKQISSI